MAAARSEAPTSSFSEEQRAELQSLLAEAVKGGQAPPPEAQPKEMPQVSQGEWASMTDRARERWVSEAVEAHLAELARRDKDRARDEKLAELEGRKPPEPEKAPSVWTRLQGFLWGQPDER